MTLTLSFLKADISLTCLIHNGHNLTTAGGMYVILHIKQNTKNVIIPGMYFMLGFLTPPRHGVLNRSKASCSHPLSSEYTLV